MMKLNLKKSNLKFLQFFLLFHFIESNNPCNEPIGLDINVNNTKRQIQNNMQRTYIKNQIEYCKHDLNRLIIIK